MNILNKILLITFKTRHINWLSYNDFICPHWFLRLLVLYFFKNINIVVLIIVSFIVIVFWERI